MCSCGAGIGVWLCGRGVLAPGLCFHYVRSVLWRVGDFRKEVAVAAIRVSPTGSRAALSLLLDLSVLSPCQEFCVQGRPCSSPKSYEKQTHTLEMLKANIQSPLRLICTGDLNSGSQFQGQHVLSGGVGGSGM